MRAIFAVLLFFFICANASTLYLTVGYCPTAFTGAGAVISVDSTTGNWTIVGKFTWPKEIFACVIEYDPTITYDHQTNELFLDYTEDFGLMITLDVKHAKVLSTIKPKDPFFTGFENMVYAPAKLGNVLKGLSATVEEEGYCDDGCFQFGQLSTSNGAYKNLSDIPFKAILDDSHYYDSAANVFWVQGSYDLREEHRCAPKDSDECLLQIDALTGELKSAMWTNFTVYKYQLTHGAGGNVLGFVESFEDCPHTDSHYLFAQVDLPTAKLQLNACLDPKVIIHEDEWISSFSQDGLLWAQSSGDAEAGSAQLLVADTTTGKVVVNVPLLGLANALGAYSGLFDVWAITWDY